MSEPFPADPGPVREFCDAQWETEVLPLVRDHIRVPAVSPAYDPEWEARGHLDRAVDAAAAWLRAVPLPGLRTEVLRAPGRTPLIFFEVPGAGTRSEETVLFYGHLDKQPEGEGWTGAVPRGSRPSTAPGCTGAAAPTTGTRCPPR